MYAALATAWNLFSGYTGYISLGQAAFFGLGAYALGDHASSTSAIGSRLQPVLRAAARRRRRRARVASRSRGSRCARGHMTFAIVTLTLLFVVQQLAFNLRSLTNGSSGLMLPTPSFPIASYDTPVLLRDARRCCSLALAALLARPREQARADAARDPRGRGEGARARRPRHRREAHRVVAHRRLTAMVGGVWAYYLTFIYPESAVDPLVMIGAVLMTFLGGRGTLWGPTIGALVLVPAQQYMITQLGASQLYLVGYAAVFMVVLLLLPRGILPSLRDASRARASGGARAASPSAPAEAPA